MSSAAALIYRRPICRLFERPFLSDFAPRTNRGQATRARANSSETKPQLISPAKGDLISIFVGHDPSGLLLFDGVAANEIALGVETILATVANGILDFLPDIGRRQLRIEVIGLFNRIGQNHPRPVSSRRPAAAKVIS